MKGSNSQKWIDAMNEEYKSMQDNKVWNLISLPEGVKSNGCKWMFKIKRDSNGNVERYKACLVAKDFTKKEGIDFKETFSPISMKDSFRTITTLVAQFDLELHQMDVKQRFSMATLMRRSICASKHTFLVLYVDDILLATNDISMLHETKRFLSRNFEMKDLGDTSFVLEI
ncbi:uncharacterized protein LOC111391391 [Olea europaea var. sylvestris]|uniref:uncharacterized protein LOC111391391 n=1 Tax=Olea europaea var. sylvestris TaxID=158386 RepID=UPI000C1D8D04|nr:uncharacterized protein LOC111391391 [Olea europaea var. sylvestris]